MTYTGDTNSADQPHGHGTLTFADAATYTGEWKDGEQVP